MSSLSLKISGKKFDYFNSFQLNLSFNSIASTFSFQGLIFDKNTKELFRPLSYREAKVYFGNELLLTGTILNVSTSAESQKTLASISGYSKTGILEDCNIPVSLYPIQYDKLTIREITEKLIRPFLLNLTVSDLEKNEIDKKYDKSIARQDQNIRSYIEELTKPRNIILSHNESGNLLFTKINVKQRSVATYVEGMPATKISLSVNGQGLHSEITVSKQTSLDIDSPGENIIKNNLVSKYRPIVMEQREGNENDTEKYAYSVMGSELRNIKLSIDTDRWKWTDGKKIEIIKPNSIIEVHSPTNYINNKTRFFVENITYSGNNEGIRATINCVLPEVYSGRAPKNIFS